MAENFGAPLSLHMQPNSAQQRMFKKCSTYLAMIAFVLQDSPYRMLTFSELLGKLEALIPGNGKSLESKIRVCLSTNKCFVKIPSNPEKPNLKKNYWKLDHSQITEKMVRRHFKGILDRFPELASKLDKEAARPSEHHTTLHSPEPAACRDVQIKCEVKFSSPFSIESLLKKDSPSGLRSRPSLSGICNLPARVQQPWCPEKGVGTNRRDGPLVEMHVLQPTGRSYPVYPTGGSVDHGLIGTGNRPVKSQPSADPSFLIYTSPRVAPHFTSPQSGYAKYPECPKYPVSTYVLNLQDYL